MCVVAASLTGVLFGAILVPDAAQCLGFAAYWLCYDRPRQVAAHRAHMETAARSPSEATPHWLKLHEALGWPDLDRALRQLAAEAAASPREQELAETEQ